MSGADQAVAVAVPEAAPISLYLDLRPGTTADWEIVSRASLAFIGALREVAYIIDPSLELRVELVSGTESSLSLNSLIKSIKDSDVLSKRNLIAIATVALIWFRHETLVWSYDQLLELLTSNPSSAHLAPSDLQVIAERTAEIIEKRLATQQVESVYRALEADPAVQGVGASPRAGERPESIVPRSEFRARSGSTRIERVQVTRRTRTTTETVTLISPVLIAGQRRWGFRGREGEFGATIRDSSVIANIIDGHTAIPMVGGIQLVIDLQTSEELREGAWHVLGRVVTKIHQIIPPAIQLDLRSPPSQNSPH